MKTKIILLTLFALACLALSCRKDEYNFTDASKQMDVLQDTRFKTDSISRHVKPDTLLQAALGLSEEEVYLLLKMDEEGLYYDVQSYAPIEFDEIETAFDMSVFRQMVEGQKFEIDTLRVYGEAVNSLPISLEISLYDVEDTIRLDCYESKQISIALADISELDSLHVILSGIYDGTDRIRPDQNLSMSLTSAVVETGITLNRVAQ